MKKITDSIIAEAEKTAEHIKAGAEYDAGKLIDEAHKRCGEIENNEKLLCVNEIKKLRKRCSSARISKRRTELLKVKQDILTHSIETAYSEITNISGPEYEAIIERLIKSRIREGSCTIYFPKDKKPSEALRKKIKDIAKSASCVYEYSYDRDDIKDGFVLVYGGIEENCCFKALFEEKKGEIFDYAAQVLFSKEG